MLEKVNSPKDLKQLNSNELKELSSDVRKALMNRLSKHGGHVGPNLGFVEATIALHYVFNSPEDKFVFDVSHQAYGHKILTGRKDSFLEESKFELISGYTNPEESGHDFFNVGHTSTSVSLALGLAKARDLKGEHNNVIAIIGDGSLSGGQALEACDYAGEFDGNLIILVNDNDMSIAENHGGMYKELKELRDTNGQSPNNVFKGFGLEYKFVKDGNNIDELIQVFESVKDIDHPIVLHVVTQKGKGYTIAEENKERWHWSMPFNPENGKPLFSFDGPDYGSLTCDFLMDKMKKDPTVVVLAAGTPTNIGFTQEKRKEAGKQFIDVGICEELAVSMTSGLAKNGAKPVFATYSSFIQRTYDQISQDLCINSNAGTILVNAASVYGMNDVTHLGIYDIPMMSNIPNLVYLAPTNKAEYFSMLDWSLEQDRYPVAIRIPSNGVIEDNRKVDSDYSLINTYKVEKEGSKVVIFALGDFYQMGEALYEALEKEGIHATLINPRYITGLDKELLVSLKSNHEVAITLEDGILDGGFGQKIASFYGDSDMKVLNYGLEKKFYDRYNLEDVLKECHLVPELIVQDLKEKECI